MDGLGNEHAKYHLYESLPHDPIMPHSGLCTVLN
jgi:hypothetical protein